MRTSKKGGRGGSWGAQPAVESGAPALATSVTLYDSRSSRRSVAGRMARGVGWLVLVIVVIGAGIAGGLYLYANESVAVINGNSNPATRRTNPLLAKLGSLNKPAVALIAGYDVRAESGSNSYAGSNSDTLMLLRADPTNDTLSLLSFPRDLNVPIYCKGNRISTYDRINAAWANCGANGGPYAAVDTLEHLTGQKVKINYLITLDFNAFKQIVNKLHGVYMNVDRRYYNPLGTGYAFINLHPGYQKLDGGDALSYVRFRHLDSDVYRNGRQQLFMDALKARLKSTLTLSNFLEVPRIIGAVKGNLAIEKADGSNVNFGEMKAYLGLLLGLPPGHMLRNAIPPQQLQNYVTPGGADELKATPGAVAAAVHRFLYPKVARHHHHHKRGKGKIPKLPHGTISVLVLNAGNRAGEASNTSDVLSRHGFAVQSLPSSTPANAPKKTHNTVIYYDPSQSNGDKAARELAPLFGSATRVVSMTPKIATFAQKAGGPLTVVAIGNSFNGKLKSAHKNGRPGSTKNARVQSGLPVALSAVRSKNGPAHFTLMVPHKVALGSSLSTDEGARLFKPVRGKQELALTFNLNGGIEYWQVEESNWRTEPILSRPTKQFVYKGRTYKEFTSGGTIQQIAVYAGHSVYWVQNTILNSLSNATMTAIAESLRPLH
jgi:LCP family protein required for cell wall assembly